MSCFALVLVVLAAVIHASWNLLSKRAASAGPTFVFAYTFTACLAYAPWALWLIAQGAVAWSASVVGCLLISGIVHLGYSLCLQRGYQVADLSVVYPVARGTGPLLAVLAAIVFLGEQPSLRGVFGLIAVVGGIALISTQGRLAAFRKPGGSSGVLWGLATGGLIASYTVVDAYGVMTLGIAPVVLDWFANGARVVLLAPLIAANPRRAREAMAGKWPLAIGVGLLSPLSYILVLAALDIGAPLSIAAPLREMSMMVGALLGMVLLKERVGAWRFGGCAVLLCGVVALGGA
ncbi:DMT family transporter [Rhodospirillum rubrum]|uniref:DMT family transporter n=1 Tax=Rhodospirillum rubrum TaxID=1085 RepID=UPI00003C2A49|nr:DMT family transporter [Rhodospirillum rubrum]AEO49571.1 hypothetical protein F11_15545 [Rhodospirillum rubrum F11]QXG79777.1 DMT family transporter [Rhodospirillum rubrum]